jgi:hypothetical protein
MSRSQYIDTLANLLNDWRANPYRNATMPAADVPVWRSWLAFIRGNAVEPVGIGLQERSTGDAFIAAHIGLMVAHETKVSNRDLNSVSLSCGRLINWIECDNKKRRQPHGNGFYPAIPARCMVS